MARITFEGNFEELCNQILEAAKCIHKDKTIITGSPIKLKDVKLAVRQNKKWTEFELNFLRDNYLAKRIPWIAAKLMRKPSSCYQMLNVMYSKGLRKKATRAGKVIKN